jgi:hypothetical protein
MRGPAVLVLALAAAAAAVGIAYRPGPVRPPEVPKPRVRLAVLVVFDQMRGDYPERWKELFRADGFIRLQTEGATFTDCHYPYSITTTGPGHASILSGTCPDRHGIVNNNWYERGSTVYCATFPRHEFVPGPTPKGKEAGSPQRMLAETVADTLRAAHPTAKIFSLSLKDRSAILPAGKKPDGAYWFNGIFVTSTYYVQQPHSWAAEFNRSRAADRWFGQEWTRFRPDVDYVKWSGPDDGPGEGKGVSVTAKDDPARGWSQRTTFPHPNTGGRSKPGSEYYSTLSTSPFGNDLLLDLAKSCVAAEKLGADDVPDLLVVSFSSNDPIGHAWGPDSQEVLDVTLRSDAVVADFLRFLDDTVGKGQYLFAVTADHGACPLPEVSRTKGIDAARVDPKPIQAALEDHLTRTFGAAKGETKPAWVEAAVSPWVYLNPRVAAAAGRSRAEVARSAAEFLSTRPGIARAFTRADLEAPAPTDDPIRALVKRSYHPDRSGDLYLVVKKWSIPSGGFATGTTHGGPYEYDTHVPLLVYGPGVSPGAKTERTTPQAAARIFSRWLAVPDPNFAEFPIPLSLEK